MYDEIKISQIYHLIMGNAVRIVNMSGDTLVYIPKGMTIQSVAQEYLDRTVYNISAEMCGVVQIKIN